jgi:5-formyltetrahydrofolate cyclo-ligase
MTAAAKKAARAAARERRSAAQARLGLDAGPAFARHFMDELLPRLGLAGGAAIAGYSPISSEADPIPLLRAVFEAGFATALPAVAAPAQPLVFRRWRPGDPLVDGPHGTREPPADAGAVQPELLVVPLLAFDKVGRRLGYGGGYYDRTLAFLRARTPGFKAVGLAFSAQEADELPADDKDQRLDWIVTERGVRAFE